MVWNKIKLDQKSCIKIINANVKINNGYKPNKTRFVQGSEGHKISVLSSPLIRFFFVEKLFLKITSDKP